MARQLRCGPSKTAGSSFAPAATWGVGRRDVGSNFFWYLKDPAGNFSEYYSDLDCIVDDALWTSAVWEARAGCTAGTIATAAACVLA